MSLLNVENLAISLQGSRRVLVEGVTFDLERGQRLGLIGESGSGKSITALALLGLLPLSMQAAGRITLSSADMIHGTEQEKGRIRGSTAAIVFQEPLSALDPLMKTGRQVAGPVRLHQGLSGSACRQAVFTLLERVKMADPRRIAASFPHELSGGQRQRVAIAMALACKPLLLIADEPTTALDVTVQAEVLALLDSLVSEEGMALLFISHDLPVVSRVVQRLLVMKDGRIVESGSTMALLASPRHPYTAEILAAARRVTTVPFRGGVNG